MALVLAAALMLALSASAAAEQPPEVAALPYREACALDHARVDPPLAEMPAYMFEDWGLPDTPDADAWSAAALVLLGQAYEQGPLASRPGESLRLYCLALRRDGDVLAAAMLSRLHARGLGTDFSPDLARHFARVAATGLTPRDWRRLQKLVPWALLLPNSTIAFQLDAAILWHGKRESEAWPALADLSERYRTGRGVPMSDVLSDALLEHASWHSAALATRYVRRQLNRLERLPDLHQLRLHTLMDRLHRAAQIDRHPAAQALLGATLLRGRIVDRRKPEGLTYLSAAAAAGEEIAVDIDAAARSMSPEERARLTGYKATGRLPTLFESFPWIYE